jgi:mannose-6-phosphate isomerase-like protein (cupin superfamily)
VHQIGYVIEGHGEIWRAAAEEGGSVDLLWPGVGVDIPVGTSFQFRATGMDALKLVLLTMPSWPGPSEAVPVAGLWEAANHTGDRD